jgi:membrane-associated phospholipid phosphatase
LIAYLLLTIIRKYNLELTVKTLRRNFILLITLLLLNTTASVIAQNKLFISSDHFPPDSSSALSTFERDISSSFNNGIRFIKIPTEFKGEDFAKIAVFTSMTAGLFFADNNIRLEVAKGHTNFQDNLWEVGRYYGNWLYPAGLSAAIYAGGLIGHNKELRITGKVLGESLIAAGLVTTLIKFLSGRSRPYKNNGQWFFKPFSVDNDFLSFPSGHTIVAFTTSTVLAERIDNIYATIGLYTLAGFSAYQRIYSDNHWLSDTFVSAVLGILIGKYFTKLEKLRENKSTQLSLNPAIGNNFFGFNLVYSW